MMRLGRRVYSGLDQVLSYIQEQLRGSVRLLGYRMMYTKCLEAGLNVRVEDVRMILHELDADAVALRRSRRLVRRRYFAKGPNFIWHIDGYDKLKPYGLCIHGCIDRFSRKLIWLKVYNTNNNPAVLGGYFFEAVTEFQGCPSIIIGDPGTEDVTVRSCQRYLRRNDTHQLVDKCFLYGRSTTNQRLESWWGYLRKSCIQHWMDLFHNLITGGEFEGNSLDKSLVQFCFSVLLQDELDDVVQVWNQHVIRKNNNVPNGRPNMMYYVPELWDTSDYLHAVSMAELERCRQDVVFRERIPCDQDVYSLCVSIMAEDDLDIPDHAVNATPLFKHLRSRFIVMLYS